MNGASLDWTVESTRRVRVVLALVTFSVAACGGAPPHDATAATAPSAAPVVPPAASSESPSTPPPVQAPEPASSSAPAPSEPAAAAEPVPTRSLGDRLFARTMSYMLNYSASPAKEKVTQACGAKAGDDAAALAACVDKERGKLVSDVLVFEKNEKSTTWRTYKRTGNQLVEVTVAQVEVGADTPEKIELKIKSETGPRQLFAGKKQLVIQSESDSSIALDDPQFGKLVYEARVGLVNQ